MHYLKRIVRWALLLLVAFVGWKVGVPCAAALRFQFALSEAAQTGATGGHNVEAITDDIMFKARQLDLPIQAENVEVRVKQREVQAHVIYEVPIDLGFREIRLKFHPKANERSMIIRGDGDSAIKATQ